MGKYSSLKDQDQLVEPLVASCSMARTPSSVLAPSSDGRILVPSSIPARKIRTSLWSTWPWQEALPGCAWDCSLRCTSRLYLSCMNSTESKRYTHIHTRDKVRTVWFVCHLPQRLGTKTARVNQLQHVVRKAVRTSSKILKEGLQYRKAQKLRSTNT